MASTPTAVTVECGPCVRLRSAEQGHAPTVLLTSTSVALQETARPRRHLALDCQVLEDDDNNSNMLAYSVSCIETGLTRHMCVEIIIIIIIFYKN
jgi:hypothetical protein